MEFGMAHSSRLQHNDTCNLINPLDAGRGASDRPYAHGLLSTASGGRLADGAGMAQAGEEFVGAGEVAANLRAQLFGAAAFFLFPKRLPESHFLPLRRRRQFGVEQGRVDAHPTTVKR